jgi:hypothetical protein
MESLRDEDVINQCKTLLDENALQDFVIFCISVLQTTPKKPFDLPTIFHRVYLHACLRGRKEAADWMKGTLYPRMDPIQQIALRQIFPYGNHLLSKALKRAAGN